MLEMIDCPDECLAMGEGESRWERLGESRGEESGGARGPVPGAEGRGSGTRSSSSYTVWWSQFYDKIGVTMRQI